MLALNSQFVLNSKTVLLGTLVAAFFLLGRNSPASAKTITSANLAPAKEKEIPILEKAGLSEFTIRAVLSVLKKKYKRDSLPIRIEVQDDKGKSIANKRMEFRHDGGKTFITTDGNGVLSFPIGTKNCIDLQMIVPNHYVVNVQKRGSSGTKSVGDGGKAKAVDVSKLKKVSYEKIDVFHNGNEKLAYQYLSCLTEIRGYINGKAGLSVIKNYGAFLSPEGALGSTIQVQGRPLFPIFYNPKTNVASVFTEWILVHEWFEISLIFRTAAYAHNKHLRFVGDGLAELFSYGYCQRHRPETVTKRLQEYVTSLRTWQIENKNKTAINLLVDFPAPEGDIQKIKEQIGVPGYATAFYFWKQLEDKHGPIVARKFIAWMLSTKDFSQKAVIAKITELTGSKPKTTIPVKSVIEEFEKLITEQNRKNIS